MEYYRILSSRIIGNFSIILVMVGVGCGFLSCEKSEEDSCFCFIGDSHIARWELQQYFPSMRTENLGIGGTGIEYIQSKYHSLNGKNAIILFGSNDIKRFNESYATDYINAVEDLGADKICIISIPPQNYYGNPKQTNSKIKEMNEKIQSIAEAKGYLYIDIFSDLIEDDNDININYFSDGLHLNVLGYELLSGILKHEAL